MPMANRKEPDKKATSAFTKGPEFLLPSALNKLSRASISGLTVPKLIKGYSRAAPHNDLLIDGPLPCRHQGLTNGPAVPIHR